MEIEKRYSSLVRDEDLMSPEEMDAWEKIMGEKVDWGEDPLGLLGRNRGMNTKIIISEGKGPDDGDLL